MFLWINLFHERRIKTYRGCVESTEPSGVTSSSLVFLFHPVGRWAFFGGDAGSVRLHSVQFREGHLSHGCPPAKHDTGQGEIQAGGHTQESHEGTAYSIHDAARCTVLLFVFVQDQMSEDLFAGQEEDDSSVDDLTPSVTSNNSDVLQRPQGTAAPSPVSGV